MTVREHVEAIVRALPPEASATLPVATLRQWLQESDAGGPAAAAQTGLRAADLTVERVSDCLGVGLSRARDIIREIQEVLGAYRRGRRWYVPMIGLEEWQRMQAVAYRRGRSEGSVYRALVGESIDFDTLRREL